jgi:hypothetical protein
MISLRSPSGITIDRPHWIRWSISIGSDWDKLAEQKSWNVKRPHPRPKLTLADNMIPFNQNQNQRIHCTPGNVKRSFALFSNQFRWDQSENIHRLIIAIVTPACALDLPIFWFGQSWVNPEWIIDVLERKVHRNKEILDESIMTDWEMDTVDWQIARRNEIWQTADEYGRD